jgi:hypothetical protein
MTLPAEREMSESKKCIIRLRKHCVVYETLIQEERQKYGSKEYVVTYCAMCIKAFYAKAKIKLLNKYSVVNTL